MAAVVELELLAATWLLVALVVDFKAETASTPAIQSAALHNRPPVEVQVLPKPRRAMALHEALKRQAPLDKAVGAML